MRTIAIAGRRRITLLLLASALLCSSAHAEDGYADPPMPAFRIETDGFGASESDIRAVLTSAGSELWRFFPEYEIEPFVIKRGKSGPITLYDRNGRGEIVVRLDTGNTYWCQYAYQFAHEFCHILCGYEDDYPGNKWFEEALCETASLFAMQAMSRAWKKNPPYPNWKDFRDALRNYVDDNIKKRDKIHEIYKKGLPGFYQTHKEALTAEPCRRDLNGAMSIVLLRLFEEQPRRWEAIRWINSKPSPKGETFQQYLQTWHDAVPDRHRAFVKQVADLYGVSIESPAGK